MLSATVFLDEVPFDSWTASGATSRFAVTDGRLVV